MRSINLQIQDSYFDKLLEYLDTLPKGAFSLKEVEDIKNIEKDILESFKDIQEGRTRALRVIN